MKIDDYHFPPSPDTNVRPVLVTSPSQGVRHPQDKFSGKEAVRICGLAR